MFNSLFAVLLFSGLSQALIFGADDRKEVNEDPAALERAKSVAMMIPNNAILLNDSNSFALDFLPATDSLTFGLCVEEKFSHQPVAFVNCTGFLIGEDLLLTAGHCMNHLPGIMQNKKDGICEYFSWVFDYQTNQEGKVNLENISSEKLYRCEEVVYGELFSGRLPEEESDWDALPPGGEYGTDFALIRLDRKVKGRKPFKLAKQTPSVGEEVSTIGYPSSLPAKLADGAKILESHYKNYFTTDLDIIGGNSGGPTFNSKGEVIGIVVRNSPHKDYVYHKDRKCSTSRVCKNIGKGDCVKSNPDDVLGAHIQRVHEILELL